MPAARRLADRNDNPMPKVDYIPQSGTKNLATDETMSSGMVGGVDGVPGKNEQETTEQDGSLSTLE